MDKDKLVAIVEKAVSGDEAAFETLYKKQAKSILFGARSWLYDKKDIEDAASEIVLNMYKSITKLKNPHAFKSWMQSIIMAVCVDVNKKSKQQRNLDIDDFESVLADYDEDGNPEGSAANSDANSDVNAAIALLPETQKRTLLLYYYENMSYQEIAQALDVSESTVSTNLIKAKKNLKITLEGKGMTFGGLTEESKSDTFAVAITTALGSEVDRLVSSKQLAAFIDASKNKIALHNTSLQKIVKKRKKNSSLKIVLSAIALTLVLVAAIAVPSVIKDAEIPVDKEAYEEQVAAEIYYKPDVRIDFIGGSDSADHINPSSAMLICENKKDNAISWAIYNEQKEELETGAGSEAWNVFEKLGPGNYSISWDVQGESEVIAKAVRDFVIK
jgi:RNA polymerase sigma-70 factor (ECF subfamily)